MANPLPERRGGADAAQGTAPALALRVELPRAVPASFLKPSFAWRHPAAGLALFAQGEALRLEAKGSAGAAQLLREATSPGRLEWLDHRPSPEPPGPWLGALAFDPDAALGDGWEGFAPARFILPELLTWSEDGRHWAAAFAAPADSARARLRQRLDTLRSRLDAASPDPVSESALQNNQSGLFVSSRRAEEAFRALVTQALVAIHSGELSKVVVARSVDVLAASAVDAARLAEALAARHPSCRTFLLRGDAGASFVGATPELLCSLEDRELRTEALAGSAPPAEARSLLGSQKDLREHRWVVDHLVRGLSPLAESISRAPAPVVRLLSNVAHLATPLSARLYPFVSLADVVAALHPTPATCGEPAAEARRFLARREGLSRGLYAGLVGLVGERRSELCVALRCALVRGRQLRAFAGAGIVEGSTAEAELRETELKSAALLGSLAAAGVELEAQA